MVKRLAPTKDTLIRLFALSGNVCAFPECHQRLFNHKNKFVGQVCHIAAAIFVRPPSLEAGANRLWEPIPIEIKYI